ncbi:antirestriction protein ArdA [Nocardia elegans]|uniref:Antirestriction protein ArdA n=1 Tax=Nocardia elegans TaxID=300029 RepID=A0ABW6TN40_9NOCA|nr:antirestriction protein ArdA [Nocardia elegans]MBF6446623.1 antirestriction protein ArdA [Nocardia elegans]
MNERHPNNHAHSNFQPEVTYLPSDDEPTYREAEIDHEQDPPRYPRIYVTRGLPLRAELTDGAWIDMARDPKSIHAELYSMFGEQEVYDREGLYIWDYQGYASFRPTTGPLGLEGVHSIELLTQVAQGIIDYGPAFSAWASAHEDDPSQFGRFERAYQGHYESIGGYVRQLLAPLGLDEVLRDAFPDQLKHLAYIDYEAIGEQLLAQDDIIAFPADGGGVWIFDEKA